MLSNYQHHLYPRQSEYVKYRGKTGRIDVKDSIITILSKKPGLTAEDIADNIYPHTLKMSWSINIPRALETLMKEGIIVREEGSAQYYLQNDAMSHDIGKVKSIMDQLMAKGLTPESIVFLSSGMIMNAEVYRAEVEGHNYNINSSSASSIVVKPETPTGWLPNPYNEHSEIEIKELNSINEEQMELAIKNAFNDDGILKDPFENISPIEASKLKEEILKQLHEEARAAIEAKDKAEMELEEEVARQEKEVENLAIEAHQRLLDLEIEVKEDSEKEINQAYKDKIKSIKGTGDLIGLDVEIKLPNESHGLIIGTILELKPDGILFLIVFSRDQRYSVGCIHNLFYADKLSYKIRS